MQKNLCITGNGNLSAELIPLFPGCRIVTRKECDLKYPDRVHSLDLSDVDILIHTAAATKTDNLDELIAVNSTATSILANKFTGAGKKFIYISTNFVYPGITGNYDEESPLSPINEYAKTKLAGEFSTRCLPEYNYLILRSNLAKNVFKHRIAFRNIYSSYISSKDAAAKIKKCVEKELCGIYNLCGSRKSIFDYVSSTGQEVEAGFQINPANPDTSLDGTKLEKALNV